ncbi:ABC transporter permease [Bacillus sp. PS06]|uniref:ABC transporter permease n=1 Tax=Bacillus sp. PS06 TaxID=2764176 RepID=UPI0017864109|nr:ABC transporter permease [Bacillus sp. PS06]MBD8070554.1 ABC transporter permease [Bacillus sp. PS06]
MKSLLIIFKEQINSIYLIQRLAVYEMKSSNKNNYLGILWEILNPMIQILIYWFVFGSGIRGGKAVGDIPFFQWMLAGIIVWFFVNPSILEGSKGIYKKLKMMSKMKFPMSVIPSYLVIANFYHHLMLVTIIIILLQFIGFPISIYMIQLPYFMLATVSLMISIVLITSTLTTIVRDVQMFIQAVMRMLLYLSPILWIPEVTPDSPQMTELILFIMKINPLFYIVEGYRSSLLGTGWYILEQPLYTLYFWCVILFLFWIGSYLHVKFRRHLIDFL